VTKPQRGYVTAYGRLLAADSAGLYAGNPGSNADFNFTAKFNFVGSAIQGMARINFRHGSRAYEILADGIGSAAANPATRHAELIANARLTDVTNPFRRLLIATGLTLNLAMTDSPDTLGITLWNAAQLYYSSSWNGIETSERPVTGVLLVYAVPLPLASGASTSSDTPGASLAVTPRSSATATAQQPRLDDPIQLQSNTTRSFRVVRPRAGAVVASILSEDDALVGQATLDNGLLDVLALDREISAARRK
jgi:hypothetical protein